MLLIIEVRKFNFFQIRPEFSALLNGQTAYAGRFWACGETPWRQESQRTAHTGTNSAAILQTEGKNSLTEENYQHGGLLEQTVGEVNL